MTIRAVDVQRLITLYGEPLTLIKKAFGAYNPATGTTTTTETEVDILGYQASFDLAEMDGVSVIRGDRKVLMSTKAINGDTFEPDIDDEIVGTGDTVSIVSVSKIMSGTTVLVYICQVRE